MKTYCVSRDAESTLFVQCLVYYIYHLFIYLLLLLLDYLISVFILMIPTYTKM